MAFLLLRPASRRLQRFFEHVDVSQFIAVEPIRPSLEQKSCKPRCRFQGPPPRRRLGYRFAMNYKNQVRIIGGSHKRRVVRFPDMQGVAGFRPTPDRVRETLFNWLGQDLTGRRCLDVFAGSGALSFEAASRNATAVVAIESSRAAAQAIAQNQRILALPNLNVVQADAFAWLASPIPAAERFDVIFLDPPFAEDPWPWLLPACLSRLADGGRIYAEAARPVEPAAGLEALRRDKAGQVHYHLFARKAPG
jgi:16S rRNA (guanine966-N2)-methyltransferase